MVNVMSYRHSNASRSSDSPGLRPTSIADEPETEESRTDHSSISNTNGTGAEASGENLGPSGVSVHEGAGNSKGDGVKASESVRSCLHLSFYYIDPYILWAGF